MRDLAAPDTFNLEPASRDRMYREAVENPTRGGSFAHDLRERPLLHRSG